MALLNSLGFLGSNYAKGLVQTSWLVPTAWTSWAGKPSIGNTHTLSRKMAELCKHMCMHVGDVLPMVMMMKMKMKVMIMVMMMMVMMMMMMMMMMMLIMRMMMMAMMIMMSYE